MGIFGQRRAPRAARSLMFRFTVLVSVVITVLLAVNLVLTFHVR